LNLYIVLTLLWTIIVLYATLSPGDQLPGRFLFDLPYLDKIIHTGLFTVQSFLMIKLFQRIRQLEKLSNWKLGIAILLCIILGVFVEIMQNFIPDRSFEPMDLVCNIIGILLGLASFGILNKIYR
jgi:hypothetical protein